MDNKNILEKVSFHDEKILKLEMNNNDLLMIANDDLGNKYSFSIKNAKITSNSNTNIKDIVDRIIITLSYHEVEDKENYLHLEVNNDNSPFNDEFYVYSNDIKITKE